MPSAIPRINPILLWSGVATIALLAMAPLTSANPESQRVPRLPSTKRSAAHKPPRLNPAKVRTDDPLWQEAQREIYLHQSELFDRAKKVTALGSHFLLSKGPRRKKALALTFDDGPHPAYTRRILEILRREKVKATFFVIGFMAEKNPELIKEIAKEGHAIANHSYSHATLTKLSFNQMMTEYKAANGVVRSLTGKSPRYCRPPGGDFSEAVVDAGAVLGMTTVLWTNDPGDYANPGQKTLLKREIRKLTPGGIVLLHDGSQDTLNTLAEFVRAAKAAGYKFVSLDELRGVKSKPAIKHASGEQKPLPAAPKPGVKGGRFRTLAHLKSG